MIYYVEFTSDDVSERIAETSDKASALKIGKVKQAEYKAAGKKGIITCFELTTERGAPMRKCYEFFDV